MKRLVYTHQFTDLATASAETDTEMVQSFPSEDFREGVALVPREAPAALHRPLSALRPGGASSSAWRIDTPVSPTVQIGDAHSSGRRFGTMRSFHRRHRAQIIEINDLSHAHRSVGRDTPTWLSNCSAVSACTSEKTSARSSRSAAAGICAPRDREPSFPASIRLKSSGGSRPTSSAPFDITTLARGRLAPDDRARRAAVRAAPTLGARAGGATSRRTRRSPPAEIAGGRHGALDARSLRPLHAAGGAPATADAPRPHVRASQVLIRRDRTRRVAHLSMTPDVLAERPEARARFATELRDRMVARLRFMCWLALAPGPALLRARPRPAPAADRPAARASALIMVLAAVCSRSRATRTALGRRYVAAAQRLHGVAGGLRRRAHDRASMAARRAATTPASTS